MRPIIPLPRGVFGAEGVRDGENVQLWRASFDGGVVALRLFRLEAPVDPVVTLDRTAAIAAQLGLEAIAPMVAAGRAGEGYFLAERWIDGSKVARATHLLPLAEDLMKLHRARKWHGGITPSRVVMARDGTGHLLAHAWSVLTTTLPRDVLSSLEPSGRAPELDEIGPTAAGPACDVYGFAVVLRSIGISSPVVDRALAEDPTDRPPMSQLAALLE